MDTPKEFCQPARHTDLRQPLAIPEPQKPRVGVGEAGDFSLWKTVKWEDTGRKD